MTAAQARAAAEVLLPAFAASDLATIERMAAPGAVVFGTDVGERWDERGALLSSLDEMRALGLRARWCGDVVGGEDWVAGTARYETPDGEALAVRVSLVFRDGLLAHGHFSLAAQPGE
ncbi:MAG TPA: hypothetical protein VGM91_03230 [Conexibacter sp.]|jgi:hypothetical protein